MTTELEPVWDKIDATEAGAVEGLEWSVRGRPTDVEADTPRERSGRRSRARASATSTNTARIGLGPGVDPDCEARLAQSRSLRCRQITPRPARRSFSGRVAPPAPRMRLALGRAGNGG